jgi:peptidoglycan/LPS O-acetylase OafA/YrhL
MTKLAFANQLRGLAALLIVITHYFGVYYGAQAVVAGITYSPELQLQAAGWVRYTDFPFFKGPFGVAVFFLISGFVIPFSLQKNSRAGFLLARAFRIYPTYLACLAIGIASIYLSSRYWQLPFALDWQRLLLNGALLHNLFGYASMDAVNWTLAVEIKFYLLAALCWRALLACRPLALAAIAAAVIGLDLLLPAVLAWSPAVYGPLTGIATDLNYVLFMLIGTLFYQHLRGLLSTWQLVAGALLLAGAFLLAWQLGLQRDALPVLAQYYGYALVVFALCYSLRTRFRPLRVLDFLADVSYPLYAVHALTGYVSLKILMDRGLPFGPAVSLVLVAALALAWLIHVGIETRSSDYGKKLGTLLSRGRVLATA